MTLSKRMFDVCLALVLMAGLAVPVAVIALLMLACQGRPVFYRSERMKTASQGFWLWKLRTMWVCVEDTGVSGGDKAARITPLGRILRRSHLDETPQLWNILKGDMSFIGPRPPLRGYVDRRPDLYARVLQSRPGLTGLATLVFHRHEERLLSRCLTAVQTDALYLRVCVPRKARLDLIYQARRSFWFDLAVLWQTVFRVLRKSRPT